MQGKHPALAKAFCHLTYVASFRLPPTGVTGRAREHTGKRDGFGARFSICPLPSWGHARCPHLTNAARVVRQDQSGGGSNPTAFERAHVKFADPVELRLYEDRCASAAHAHMAFDETRTLQAVWRLYAALWEATLDSEFGSNVARTAHDLSECLEVRARSPPSQCLRERVRATHPWICGASCMHAAAFSHAVSR
jgi:hypothetical protein